MRHAESSLKEQHENRLRSEKSPYLLQHADNPVEWFPWGEDAFAKARQENRPIFLSVGYSTCHWCHVMAHESFEDKATAEIMNREFVNIKVDREERPDVDRVYMTFVQATAGHGGWPMSVWLTPDLKPFVGGTYFPPDDRYGQPGFQKVLQRIAAAWKQDHEKIAVQGTRIIDALREAQDAAAESGAELDRKIADAAFEQLSQNYDEREGGFGPAPKFPRPTTLNFLARIYARGVGQASRLPSATNATETVTPQATRALEMHLSTLRKMGGGGMHDHVGGGFHRYSVDGYWHVPHFEKMLYDQAQLATAYLDAFQIVARAASPPVGRTRPVASRRDHRPAADATYFENVARDILGYVSRDMTSKQGGFFSAEDADSLLEHGKAEHAEGAFYVWTSEEVDAALGKEAAEIFSFHYGVQPHGNAPEGADPHDEFRGKNILIERHTPAETAARFKKSETEIAKLLARSREKLFKIRAQRPRPHLDDKIITAWNGLMISAYARGAQILEDRGYLDRATGAAEFVRANLYDPKRKILFRSYREGRSTIEGFADDYAFFIQGLLDLYEAGFEVKWLKFAEELQLTQDRLFFDEKNGGYFSGSANDPSILLRMKEDNDGAEPAASSVAALNLLRLAQVRANDNYEQRAAKTMNAFAPQLSRFASALPQMLVAADFKWSGAKQIVVAGNRDNKTTKALLRAIHLQYLPNKTLLLADCAEGQKYLGERIEAIRDMSIVDGKPAAYVCENFTCKAPVTDPKELAKLL